MPGMRRREFVSLFGGAAAWPLAARAQQRERMRRIGVLGIADDVEAQSWVSVLVTRLQELGWTNGRNVQIDYRFGLVGSAVAIGARPDIANIWLDAIGPEAALAQPLSARHPGMAIKRSLLS
jgi:putative ABC transport system substrate-binding protein